MRPCAKSLPAATAYAKTEARSAAVTLAGRAIAPMPSPKDPARRADKLAKVLEQATGDRI